MDLITPAQTWAADEAQHPDAPPAPRMSRLQQVVMFFSVVLPFVGLIAAIALLYHRPDNAFAVGLPELIVMGLLYVASGFGVTLGFHRLLTHKSYETYRPVKLLLAILGSAGGQGMCIRWCATHRRHHQVSDREGDPHSPHHHGEGAVGLLRGMLHAHVLWCFDADRPNLSRSVGDLLEDKALLLIDRLYFLWVFLGILLPGVALGLYHHSWHGFVAGITWGGFARIFLLQHVTWSINSICHVWGARPYNSSDHSTNNYLFAILALGEGHHNNHHAFPTSARHGLEWYEIDLSYMLLKGLSYLGLAWDIRTPSPAAMEAKRVAGRSGQHGDPGALPAGRRQETSSGV